MTVRCPIPTNKHMFNPATETLERKSCELCSKLTIKIPEQAHQSFPNSCKGYWGGIPKWE